jgi:hypothetical protein
MCFGSKPKVVQPPPPTPPTTFDYSSAERGTPQAHQQAVANATASGITPAASFGSELSGTPPTQGVQ